jgi:CDP-diacylglycerol--glycerol-3-phosphate 3-phosphatidyltransferase
MVAPIARALSKHGISPNQVTVIGCVLTLAAAGLILLGSLGAAGALFLFASSLDMLDGTMARMNGNNTRAGAFLDSALDRVAEGAIFSAIAVYFLHVNDPVGLMATLAAWLGAFMTSYVRARCQSLGADLPEGLVQRAERVIALSVGLLYEPLLLAIMVGLAVLGLGTAFYRLVLAWKRLRDDDRDLDLEHGEPDSVGDGDTGQLAHR